MGSISDQQETHVERSSSTTFAMRWKHANWRYIGSVALVSCTAILIFLVLMYGTTLKQVSIIVDGQETVVQTNQGSLQRLLDEQAITLGEHDRINKPLDAKLKDGDQIVIDHAIPVRITADGKTETKYTLAKTVTHALQEFNLTLGEHDQVSPELQETLTPGAEVRIVRVLKKEHEVTEPIPFETVQQSDDKLAKGKQKVVQEGQEGVLVKKFEQVFEDGVMVSESLVGEEVETPSIDKIVSVGTKKEVVTLSIKQPGTKVLENGEITFSYKEILNNVQLTAYTAAEGGKSEDDPYYGYTASGTKVKEGQTIAVDPKVIPLGWWVYIDGIGFRRAEDTGGAVKGKIIDIYYENQDYVNRFGRKKGYTVYVIGPKKPIVD